MNTVRQPIIYASQPASVNMGDAWYEVASLDHFWIRRRFKVFQKLADRLVRGAKRIGEIGCGNGLVQRSLEDQYDVDVTGFDLNELALKRNVCRKSQLYYYDVHQRCAEFRAAFDLVIMFDILEHIADEVGFLESTQYHLGDSGTIIVNVPAIQSLYSDYDRAVGHLRRYSIRSLRAVAERSGLRVRSYTYWGAPLLPFLLVRKGLVKFRHREEEVIASGLDPGSPVFNHLLGLVARCERIPQGFLGTSLMAVVERAPNPQSAGYNKHAGAGPA